VTKKQSRKRSTSRPRGRIKPHEGSELDLMLKGKKPLARFAIEHKTPDALAQTEASFQPHVARGTFLRFQFKGDEFDRLYFCQPTEEWRVKLLELIDTALEAGAHNFTIYDLHRIDGTLLGYSKSDIEFFISNWRQHHEDD